MQLIDSHYDEEGLEIGDDTYGTTACLYIGDDVCQKCCVAIKDLIRSYKEKFRSDRAANS